MSSKLKSFDDLLRLKPIVGMIHLGALPGSPRAHSVFDQIVGRAIEDAETLATGGCHALMMENFGDVPFLPGRVSATVVAAMTKVAVEVKRKVALPLGINVLRNDGLSALGIALATGSDFIRVNVLTGARVTDQGVIGGIADVLLREQAATGAQRIKILADVDVKHSAPLAERSLTDEVKDTLLRGLADAVIVSGSGTGAAVDVNKLKLVRQAAQKAPVLIGSGVSVDTIEGLMPYASGFIVGTSLKHDGRPENKVELKRVQDLIAKHKSLLERFPSI
ncbi:MAG: BtpA/SgcQ family protein [Deltaproteobacteria bacterium]|nr:BtpA/SgcQ family protein [Deltaproteobacteria bacterium]